MNNQKTKEDFNKKIAECAGLWLAEGDNKSNYEITFSNNCWKLVELFHTTVVELFNKFNPKIRIYVYNSTKERIKIPLENVQVNYYIDKRANKPYYIWRLASTKLVKEWKDKINVIVDNNQFYVDILRGFFAGEGNIKTGSHNNRTIRISQGKPLKLLESILTCLEIDFKYYAEERSYVITGKSNWDKCAKIKIANLHQIKKLRFWNVYGSFKEEHYKSNYLKNEILQILEKPYTSQQLSLKLKRSQTRVYDILGSLKKLSKIKNFRVKNKDFWIRKDQNLIILSHLKYDYLLYLKDSEKNTQEISDKFKVCWKSAFNRLKELEKLGLVARNRDKNWRLKQTNKEIMKI